MTDEYLEVLFLLTGILHVMLYQIKSTAPTAVP